MADTLICVAVKPKYQRLSRKIHWGMLRVGKFWAMPKLLRFMTAHALACTIFVIVSVVPNDSFAIEGHPVSQAEWWSSGAGPFASLLGLLGLVSGAALLMKSKRARLLYLGFLTVALVAPYPFLGNPLLSLAGALMVAATAWYLFKVSATALYFEREPIKSLIH
ncbi:hypothetical protein [Dyella silvatica]|uniref:hypothetical protein n=1 Tax=Dyella silvatica TaxID=2992128 RepID=UPI002259A313|nr:hypothetical protein [Dyella silvatica]